MNNSNLYPHKNGLTPVEMLKARFRVLPKGMIQVGAHNGREVSRLANSGVPKGIFIDPLDETFGRLSERVAEHKGFTAIQALIGTQDGQEVDFRIASNDGESSSILEPGTHLDVKPAITFGTTRKLVLRSLDKLLEDHKLDATEYDLLFLDTQGAELHVLKGALETLKAIDFIWMEVSIGEIYKGDTPLSEFIPFLRLLGFEIAWCELKRFGWGDALFVRRDKFDRQTG